MESGSDKMQADVPSTMYHSMPSKWTVPDNKIDYDSAPNYFFNVHSYLYHYDVHNEYNN